MKKLVLLFALFIAFSSIAYAQPKRIIMTYESFGQEQEVKIDLKQLFGGSYNFVVGETEYVDVKINFLTKIATIKAKDPKWLGKEKIVFATDPKYLISVKKLEEMKEVEVTEEGKVKETVKENVSYIIVSEEQVLESLDKIVKDSFEFILPNIESRKVEVLVRKDKEGLIIDLSDEANINISFAQDPKKPAIAMDMGYNTSKLKAPEYALGSSERYYLALIFVFAFLVIYIYFKFGPALESVIFRSKGVSYTVKVKAEKIGLRGKFLDEVRNFERKQGSPAELYKNLVGVTNTFLLGYYRQRSFNPKELMKAMQKENSSMMGVAREYFSRATKPYSPEKITQDDLKEFISIVKKLSKKI